MQHTKHILFIDADNKSPQFAPTLVYLAKSLNIASAIVAGNHNGAAVARWEKRFSETEGWSVPMVPFVSENTRDAADVALIVHAGALHATEAPDTVFLFFSDDHLFGIAAQTFEKLGRRTIILCGNPSGFSGLGVAVMAVSKLDEKEIPATLSEKQKQKPKPVPPSQSHLMPQRTTKKSLCFEPGAFHAYLLHRGITSKSDRREFVRKICSSVSENTIAINKKINLTREIRKFLTKNRAAPKTRTRGFSKKPEMQKAEAA